MATAKKIPDNNYQVQLTLSAKEARYLTALTGCVVGNRPTMSMWGTLNDVVGPSSWPHGEYKFDYDLVDKRLRDWVEYGE